MSTYNANVWNQLKNITSDDLIKALKKSGWIHDVTIGASQAYIKNVPGGSNKRVTIHLHPKKTYGTKLLKGLLDAIGWSIAEMKKLKLIK